MFAGGAPDLLTASPFENNGLEARSINIQRTAAGFVDTSNTVGFPQAIGASALSSKFVASVSYADCDA